mgnify:CR=1 FL=1
MADAGIETKQLLPIDDPADADTADAGSMAALGAAPAAAQHVHHQEQERGGAAEAWATEGQPAVVGSDADGEAAHAARSTVDAEDGAAVLQQHQQQRQLQDPPEHGHSEEGEPAAAAQALAAPAALSEAQAGGQQPDGPSEPSAPGTEVPAVSAASSSQAAGQEPQGPVAAEGPPVAGEAKDAQAEEMEAPHEAREAQALQRPSAPEPSLYWVAGLRVSGARWLAQRSIGRAQHAVPEPPARMRALHVQQ